MWKVELSADYKHYRHRVGVTFGEFFKQLFSRRQTFSRLLSGSQRQIEVQQYNVIDFCAVDVLLGVGKGTYKDRLDELHALLCKY